MIAHRFPAYTFEILDQLPFDRVFELCVAAEWLGEQESKASKAPRSARRKR
ncbi:MAG: hypothetical protein WC326_08110 [Candidatus Delongbacteria bacterium]